MTRVNNHLSCDIDAVLEAALEKNLDRRFASALDLADDLRRARGGEPTWARSSSRND